MERSMSDRDVIHESTNST